VCAHSARHRRRAVTTKSKILSTDDLDAILDGVSARLRLADDQGRELDAQRRGLAFDALSDPDARARLAEIEVRKLKLAEERSSLEAAKAEAITRREAAAAREEKARRVALIRDAQAKGGDAVRFAAALDRKAEEFAAAMIAFEAAMDQASAAGANFVDQARSSQIIDVNASRPENRRLALLGRLNDVRAFDMINEVRAAAAYGGTLEAWTFRVLSLVPAAKRLLPEDDK
jgi:hypothetical protein